MISIFRTPVLLFVCLSLPIEILAQEIRTRETKGTVLEATKDKITVLTKEGEKSFRINMSTEGWKDIKEGSKVTVEYKKAEGELRATRVEPTGAIGSPCPCNKCPELAECKKESKNKESKDKEETKRKKDSPTGLSK